MQGLRSLFRGRCALIPSLHTQGTDAYPHPGSPAVAGVPAGRPVQPFHHWNPTGP